MSRQTSPEDRSLREAISVYLDRRDAKQQLEVHRDRKNKYKASSHGREAARADLLLALIAAVTDWDEGNMTGDG